MITIDIETRPNLADPFVQQLLAEAEADWTPKPFPPFDPGAVKMANLKDPDKIAEKLRLTESNHERDRLAHESGAQAKAATAREEWIRGCCLDPLRTEIFLIGIYDHETGDTHILKIGESSSQSDCWNICVSRHSFEDEAAILAEFWRICAEHNQKTRPPGMAGWNITGFDLPQLVARTRIRGYRGTVPIDMPEFDFPLFRDRNVVELMDLWAVGKTKPSKLDHVARALGLPAKPVYKAPDGRKLLPYEFPPGKAEEYLRHDIAVTARITELLLHLPE